MTKKYFSSNFFSNIKSLTRGIQRHQLELLGVSESETARETSHRAQDAPESHFDEPSWLLEVSSPLLWSWGMRQLTQFSLDSKILSDPNTLGPFACPHEPLSRDRFSLARNQHLKKSLPRFSAKSFVIH